MIQGDDIHIQQVQPDSWKHDLISLVSSSSLSI